VNDINSASRALARREGIRVKEIEESIGIWPRASKDPNEFEQLIGEWAERMTLDAVIWTALPPKFKKKKGRVPSADEVVSHLSALPHEKRRIAEEYIRMTPRQIDTNYRRQIEGLLHWTPLGDL
jgi:hypothetical protein